MNRLRSTALGFTVLLGFIAAVPPLRAQFPIGRDFRVSDDLSGQQVDPRAAAAPARLEQQRAPVDVVPVGAVGIVAVPVVVGGVERPDRVGRRAVARDPRHPARERLRHDDRAVGRADQPISRALIGVRFGDLVAAKDGAVSRDYDEAAMSAYMKRSELEISVVVGSGAGSARMYTCDLTKRYVEINGDYRS